MTILFISTAIVSIICNVLFVIIHIRYGNYEAALGWGFSAFWHFMFFANMIEKL